MVLLMRNRDAEDTMPQTVPSAGFTPPCDYSTFAENFDLSLLPGGDLPISPSTQFYSQPLQLQHQQQQRPAQPKIHTTFYPSSPESSDIELGPDFQTLLSDDCKEERSGYLEVPIKSFGGYRENSFYPSSPEQSLYTASPGSVYSTSPRGDDHYHHLQQQQQQQQQQHLQPVKREVCSASTSPLPGFFSPFGIKEEAGCYLFPTSPSSYSSSSPEHHVGGQQVDNTDVLGGLFNSTTSLDKQIKQESTVDFTNILQGFQDTDTLRQLLEKDLKPKPPETDNPKDHRLLREVLRDTSFQKRFNIRPIEFLFGEGDEDVKMEEPGESNSDLMRTCNEPVIKEAIEKTTKDVVNTCATLGISADPSQWDPASVLSWLRWTCKNYRNHTNPPLPEPIPEQWEISGATLITLPVSEFVRRMPEGGAFLHGHLEIWKAAFSSPEEEANRNWGPETTSSNASSGDGSDEEEEEPPQPQSEHPRPSTSTRSSSNIHLWQFLKELLGSNQHGACIRWVHREEGIFKIEDSVKVARLWGKRKNRPAMNYDKLSRSIRQYYKKGIMKKPERSQRLVYQFCAPYNM